MKISSHSVGYLLILVIVSFEMQDLNPICLFLFLFPRELESYSENNCLCLYLPVFSCSNFKSYIKIFDAEIPRWQLEGGSRKLAS
jgi:hypothetical protein